MGAIGSFIPVPFDEVTISSLRAGPGQDLSPVSPSIGIHTQQVVNKCTGLVLQSDPFDNHGEDFCIRDLDGEVRVVCRSSSASNGRKVITDPQGNTMISIKSKTSISRSYIGEGKNGEEIFRMKKKFALGSSMEVSFQDTFSSRRRFIQLRGDFWVGSADILLVSGPLIAQFSRRQIQSKGLDPSKETYIVNVAPGVDLALITAICICFEESKDK
ncbi:uncharacterized protein IL334_002991 [Kwoniella shivajii]|uniref:Uncharacterized protein n=1 Tax=Kwoniella shivajii TaxID=564305 RepID=A0ABZ1CW98_9TREE|nr:hypothetical protein IL334_002991 [Kwoniella shivajii]